MRHETTGDPTGDLIFLVMSVPFLQTAYGRLQYLEWGDVGAPAIVVLHRLEEAAGVWKQLGTSMSNRYHMIALDQRGHGSSQWASYDSYNLLDFVDDIRELLDKLNIEKCMLVGHSEGGRHAIEYTVRFPKKVQALVFVDGTLGTIDRMSYPMVSGDLIGSTHNVSFAKLIERLRALQPNSSEETLLDQIRCFTSEIESDQYSWSRDPVLLDVYEWPDMWNTWERLECPTLIIRGRQSKVLDHKTAVRMRESNSHTRLAELEGSGHWVHQEIPSDFEITLRWFLDGLAY